MIAQLEEVIKNTSMRLDSATIARYNPMVGRAQNPSAESFAQTVNRFPW